MSNRLFSFSRLRPRSGYDVLAVIATCAALGTGGAYAAGEMFGSQNVIDESLLSQDIKNESLTGADIQEATLSGVKLSGIELVEKQSTWDSSATKSLVIYCPVGKKVVGSGHVVWDTNAPSVDLFAANVFDDVGGVEFVATEYASESASWAIKGQIVCADAAASGGAGSAS